MHIYNNECCDFLSNLHRRTWDCQQWKCRRMSQSSCHRLLLHEGCVSCCRAAGITDLLISSYYQSAGSLPGLGIWLTDNKSSRLAITVSHSALAAAQSRTLAFISFSSLSSACAWSVTLYSPFVPASWSLQSQHFLKQFAYLSWKLNLYTTRKIKCGAMRLILSGWVKY